MLNQSNIRKANKTSPFQYNCWGGTVYALNASKHLYWWEADEMEYWLQEKTKIVKTPKKGDILVMHNRWGTLIHTAIYLGKKQYWHKPGGWQAEYCKLERIMTVYEETASFVYRRVTKRRKELK